LGYVGKVNRAKLEKLKEYGYSPQSTVGYTGVEEYYDSFLRGVEGGIQIEVNSRGQQVRILSFKDPVQGQNITLTLDSKIQTAMRDLLGDSRGVIIAMDMDNGEILGTVSSPSYDPNLFTTGDNQKAAALMSKNNSPLLNRAIKGAFPPGSVFKVAMALAALDFQKIKQQTSFICTGTYQVGDKAFRCTHAHGNQNLIEAIAHSCNIYFYHLGQMLGVDAMNRYAQELGLGNLTLIDLPYEQEGNVPGRFSKKRGAQRWYMGDILNFAIGQGDLLTTPLQLLRMMAIVGREGDDVQPHLIKNIGDEPVTKYSFFRHVAIDPTAYQLVNKGLRAAVNTFSGTANAADIHGLFVAGKTGTAQTSGNQDTHAWFVGYAIGEQRKIAFCVFLEHGGSSQNATIVARSLLMRLQEQKYL
ncbi:MAG: penicillin-binding transpeptidase domain-containing protein, partial [Candidatus Omnitrophota bacterium]|nr:penicillin-binding transpeptidase domain-containing protein [Candidatus Omnitrophota bacterium]